MADRNQNRNQTNANRIRGPTSALSSFLREHGIHVRNRRFDRTRQPANEGDEPTSEQSTDDQASTVATEVQTEQEASVNILYTPNVTQQTATTRSRTTRATKRKKKRPADDDDEDYEDEEDISPVASSSTPRANFRAKAGRTRVEFCSQCKCRFSKIVLPGMEEASSSGPLLCPGCKSGDKKNPEPKKRRRVVGRVGAGSRRIGNDGYIEVPSLQDICIRLSARYIEDIEALGDIGMINMDKICKIISKNRKLNNENARLFMDPRNTRLSMYDCTNMTDDGFLNIAHFCHDLQYLKLVYCGRMTDQVITTYTTHLPSLKQLDLDGPFLVTNTSWINFIKSFGSQLETFALAESPRFDIDCLTQLTEQCVNLKELKLSRVGKLDNEWLTLIANLKNLTKLELSWPAEDRHISTSEVCDLIKTIGSGLTDLTLQGCYELTDEVLTDAILPNCGNLTSLNLCECDGFTSDGVKGLFDGWVEQKSNRGLSNLVLTRCTKLNDEAIESALRHSRNTLSALSINSLDELSSKSLEAIAGEGEDAHPCVSLRSFDCGFVRALDDIVMDKLIKSCKALEHLKVWGCHKLTECVPLKPGLRIEGRESDTS
ncbi:UV-damaged DNA-binding protein rad7 [Umbelopsis sp. WA50703]